MSARVSRPRLRGVRRARRVLAPVLVALLVLGAVPVGATALTLLLPAMRATAVPVATTPATCAARSLQVVAHPDDDLLFMNPDIVRDIEAGACVRTIYLTTGDAARDETYWRAREDGIRAAYATMAGVDDEWRDGAVVAEGRTIATTTLTAAPGISLVFLHLPDGNRRGTGNAVHGHESLRRLWLGEIETITAVDGSATYDLPSLRRTLTALVDDFRPTVVRAQDWTIGFREGDNADHTAAAFLARSAVAHADAGPEVLAYAGYPSWTQPANVNGRWLGLKAKAILAYASHDPKLCTQLRCVESLVTAIRAGRQYVVVHELADAPAKVLSRRH
ncbi:MAG: PIG-L family deacetylase [Actinomycetales bacterium]|jgi:LmbE family N-acetylglucosaminyl deacetylase|nr:PIG-L family deacetylase [Actinomycetales bacterium]